VIKLFYDHYTFFIKVLLHHFYIRPFKKTGRIMGTPAVGGRVASTGFLLSKSKSFHQVFIKLDEYVGVHSVSTKFNNQPNTPRQF